MIIVDCKTKWLTKVFVSNRPLYLAMVYFITILLLPINGFGQLFDYQRLSNRARVSLLTCTPGEAIYEAFGHSALRIKDDSLQIDWVFNYGIFDFDQPNFFINYAKGYLNYMLGVQSTENFLYSYAYYGRGVRELELQLPPDDVQRLWQILLYNASDEHKYYLYDYFFDNCSTRLWAVIDSATGHHRLKYNPITTHGQETFRSLIARYAVNNPWGLLGIDLGLGSTIDTTLTDFHYMFLPDYLEAGMQAAQLLTDSTYKPLAGNINILHTHTADFTYRHFFTPLNTFWLLFLTTAVAVILTARAAWPYYALYYICTLAGGLVGVVLVLLLFTDHEAAYYNYNLIWANPILLGCALAFGSKAWRQRLSAIYFILATIFIVAGYWLLPQHFNPAFFPITLTLWLLTGVQSKAVLIKQRA